VFVLPYETHVGPDLRRRNCGQVAHAHQIVGRASKSEDPMHFAHSATPNLPHQREGLQPAKAFFDPFPLSLTEAHEAVDGSSVSATCESTMVSDAYGT
jgi:hypothetical protein